MVTESHIAPDDRVIDHARRDDVPLLVTWTIAEAIDALRARPVAGRVVYFYVVDGDDRLVGVMPARSLLMAQPESRVRDTMITDVIALPHTATVGDATELFVQRRLLALPIVDERRRLVGVTDVGLIVGEVTDLARREQADTVFQMIGARVSEKGGAWRGWTLRFPWLLCNIAGGLIAAFIAARHSALLETIVALALFMPVVLALSESVGMQAVTLTLQRLHGTAGGGPAFAGSLRREGLTGLLLGASCGATIGGVVWLFERRPELAAVVATTVMASMTTSAVAGVALPAALRALRWNPRVAAGPIVLAIADFGTLLIYFALAGLWLT